MPRSGSQRSQPAVAVIAAEPSPEPRRPVRSARAATNGVRGLRRLAPGAGLAAVIAGGATIAGGRLPVVGSPVIAIVCGMAVAVVHRPSASMRPGIAFVSKKMLQAAVVVLGSGLALGQVITTGTRSLPVLLGTLAVALGAAWCGGRLLHLRSDLTTLIGVGTAICGASAIAATEAVIGADEADVSYAIATIFTFNVVAVLTFPAVGYLLGLPPHSFGLWSGTAINDLSSVVAATTTYGHASAAYGVVVKLTRTLAIIPIALGLALRRGRRLGATATGTVSWRGTVPTFIVFFLAAVAANSLGLVPHSWHRWLSDCSLWMITAALAAIGLSTDLGHIRRAGVRPLVLGAGLWVTVALTSLGLQALTGTL